MKKMRTILLATVMATGVCSAQAEMRTVLGGSITGGGETLASGSYTNGDTWKVRSGGFDHLFGGVEYTQADSPITVQANIGYHIDDTNASNGSISFSRWPAELLVMWRPENPVRFGVGFRKALSPKLSSSGDVYIGNYSFESDLGMVVQGEYLSSKRTSILLRWVKESYTINGSKIDGNHVGLGLAVRF